MIIAKKVLKITCALALVIFVFSSCISKGGPTYPYLELITFGSESAEETEDVTPEYRLVIPEGASAQLFCAAEELCDKISAKTEAISYIVYDSEKVTDDPDTVEIVIGNTSREVSRSRLYGMRANDYVCSMTDDAIVIGGVSERATVAAIDRFCEEILPVSTAKALIPENGGFSFEDTYAVSSFKLNGYDISSYAIVVEAADKLNLWNLALEVRQRFSDEAGYHLDVIPANADTRPPRAIYICEPSDDFGANIAKISPVSDGVAIRSCDMLGIFEAVDEFLELMLGGSLSGDIERKIEASVSVEFVGAEYRIATLDPEDFLPLDSPSKITDVTSPVLDNKPDAVFYGVLGVSDARYVTESLIGYAPVRYSESDKTYSYATVDCQKLAESERDGVCIGSYFIGTESSGFSLVIVSGEVSEDLTLDPSDTVLREGAPLAVIIHTSGEGDVLVSGLDPVCIDRREGQYNYVCYATEDSFEITLGNTDDRICYRDVLIERIK